MKLSTSALATALTGLALTLAPRALAAPGDISLPQPGTQIAPGASFNFSYEIRGDYCTSSYAYSVYLVTDAPTSLQPSDIFMGGYFFGRFDAPNYPAVPYPTNPAPPQLVMPNFSQPQGGWGSGQSASDKTWQLAVIEEWDGCAADVSTLSYSPRPLPVRPRFGGVIRASCAPQPRARPKADECDANALRLQGPVGRKFSLASVPIVYNATGSS